MQSEDGMKNVIGARVKAARLNADPPLSMTALSRRILLDQNVDISSNAIAKVELGTRYANDFEVLAFARALGVRGDWLLGLED